MDKNDKNGREVVVRAYRGEPVRLRAVGQRGGVIAVEGRDGARIGFPASDVFVFDDGLYRRLRSAFDRSDPAALDRCWRDATPITPSRDASKG